MMTRNNVDINITQRGIAVEYSQQEICQRTTVTFY